MVHGDNEYHAAIEPGGEGYIVTFAYGRRGSTMTTGTKTPAPVTLDEAHRIFDKLVASKAAKGYRESGTPAAVHQRSGGEGADTGLRCQILNPVEESEVPRLLANTTHCLQQKHDGRRLMVRKQGNEITGINRRGIIVALPAPVHDAVAALQPDLLIDGEAVGDTLHAFDLLELNGHDLRPRGYLNRFAGLLSLLGSGTPALLPVSTAVDPKDKAAAYHEILALNREGVVFKEIDAPFSPGRPNSGGSQLKFKFVETASFVVTGHHTAKRSVALGLYDGNKLVPAGNVTIPQNHAIPQAGTVAEVRYLYAHRESGAIYQPVYLGPRTDIPPAECGTDQLKYKVTDH